MDKDFENFRKSHDIFAYMQNFMTKAHLIEIYGEGLGNHLSMKRDNYAYIVNGCKIYNDIAFFSCLSINNQRKLFEWIRNKLDVWTKIQLGEYDEEQDVETTNYE